MHGSPAAGCATTDPSSAFAPLLLIPTCAPWTRTIAVPFTVIALPSPFTLPLVLAIARLALAITSTSLAWITRSSLQCTQASPVSASTTILLFFASSVTRPTPPPSSMTIRSSSSSNTIRLPPRDTIARWPLPPSALASGGLSLPFHSAPSTSGRAMSP